MKNVSAFRRHSLKVLGALALCILGVFAFILYSPSRPPSEGALDYLKMVDSLQNIKGKVAENLLANVMVAQAGQQSVQDAIHLSEGLIKKAVILRDGAILVDAYLNARNQTSGNGRAEVVVIFVPQVEGGEVKWKCFGDPQSVLPQFCGDLKSVLDIANAKRLLQKM